MRVYVSIREDVEVDVDVLDVLRQLPVLPDEEETATAVTAMLSRCMRCLVSLPDEMLNRLSPGMRTQLVKHLREQADRYEIKVIPGVQ